MNTRALVWSVPTIVLSLAAIAFAAIPAAGHNRLFIADVLLTLVLALNAVRYLVLRQTRIGIVMTILTGVSVFFVAEWFIKLR